MELFFHQFKDGEWGVGFETTQGETPALLQQYVKDAIKEAVGKFNKLIPKED